jgi:hypothetical protein
MSRASKAEKYEKAKAKQQEVMKTVPQGSPSAKYDQAKAKSQAAIEAAEKKAGGGK